MVNEWERANRLFGHGMSFGLAIIKKLEDQKGFIVLPRRWVIERSFGSLVKQHRLTHDHEKNPRHHEASVYLAFIGIMTQHLTTLHHLQLFAGLALRKRNQSTLHSAHAQVMSEVSG